MEGQLISIIQSTVYNRLIKRHELHRTLRNIVDNSRSVHPDAPDAPDAAVHRMCDIRRGAGDHSHNSY